VAQSLIGDAESEQAVAGSQVLKECKVVPLRTQLPFVMSHLTITARYVALVYMTITARYVAPVYMTIAA